MLVTSQHGLLRNIYAITRNLSIANITNNF
jgi:hypothetical protein